MFRDPFIAEAWQLRHQANLVPFQVFLSAAVWLEERYQRSPSAQTARSYAAHAVRRRERAGEPFTPEQAPFLQ